MDHSEQHIAAGNSTLTHRRTPWDEMALGVKTDEIMIMKYTSTAELVELLTKYIDYVSTSGIELSYIRVDSSDHVAKAVLQSMGFYYAESSIEMKNGNLSKFAPKDKYRSKLILYEVNDEHDYDQIRNISQRAFNHSRFHEDANIEIERARIRYRNWVDDLIKDNYEIVAYRTEGIVHAFMAYKVSERRARLMLGGSDIGKGYLSPALWTSVLCELKRKGVASASGLVSASNITIINMYIELGFKVDKTFNGFHRIINHGEQR